MMTGLIDKDKPLPDGWQQIVIRGGGHNGQHYNVRSDEDKLTLYVGPKPHTYWRSPRGKAEFIAETMLGGGSK